MLTLAMSAGEQTDAWWWFCAVECGLIVFLVTCGICSRSLVFWLLWGGRAGWTSWGSLLTLPWAPLSPAVAKPRQGSVGRSVEAPACPACYCLLLLSLLSEQHGVTAAVSTAAVVAALSSSACPSTQCLSLGALHPSVVAPWRLTLQWCTGLGSCGSCLGALCDLFPSFSLRGKQMCLYLLCDHCCRELLTSALAQFTTLKSHSMGYCFPINIVVIY